MSEPSAEDLPLAEVKSTRAPWRWLREEPTAYWILAAIALVVSIGLPMWAYRSVGPLISIRFAEGHGLKAGDQLRHRGIEVGQVKSVRLDDSLRGVLVEIRLEPAAAGLAREGSRFWIERPQISLARIRSLETVVGAKYVAVIPGAADAPPRVEFDGEKYPLTVSETGALEIQVTFDEGHGLVLGDPLRYRGIVVGEVTEVNLATEFDGVEVRVRLSEHAERLARAGSRFWVERPQLGLQGVRGLETLVGGRYMAVDPGPTEAERQLSFVGLSNPPPGVNHSGHGLELLLVGSDRFGVETGAPVRYRGLAVGSVVAVALSPDSTEVECTVHIEPGYRALVRDNSRFWATSGFNLDIGFSGFELSADTLSTIAAGGVSFATPTDAGARVKQGHRFELAAESDAEWLKWRPRLPSGPMILDGDTLLPRPQRLTLEWEEKRLAIRTTRKRSGLGLLLESGELLAPRQLLEPPPNAAEDSIEATFAGLPVPVSLRASATPLATAQLSAWLSPEQLAEIPTWPIARTRVLAEPEDCLLVTDLEPPMPLPAGRLAPRGEGGWHVDASISVPESWNGAAVVAIRDASLLGCVLLPDDSGRAIVVPLR